MTVTEGNALGALEARWRSAWPAALGAWSRFTKLAEPRYCLTDADEHREKLSGSFAMIRIADHAIVISLSQIRDLKLDGYAREILAHEIGHHVYTPGDARDNARLQARVRAGLPTRESFTGMICNLYTDLLINDRLQRDAGLDMAGVYRALKGAPKGDRLWQLYMQIYETLWRLPSGTLTAEPRNAAVDLDAGLGARVIRTYAKDWLGGAGRFAALLLPYLLEIPEAETVRRRLPPWFDADQAGAGAEIPDGLVDVEAEEQDGAIHPAEDEELTGIGSDSEARYKGTEGRTRGTGRELKGGVKNPYRGPAEYRDLLKSVGVTVSEHEITMRYYRERALPFLIRFPTREVREALDPLPEGLDTWDVGDSLREIDWPETIARSPQVIPGVTTVQRHYGASQGSSPGRIPLDLYIGIDCSGSMTNPSQGLSYPVLAGTVIALSALRAGAQVMACLSGEPGRFTNTDGFVRNERAILGILTDYLGTGYAFGIARLEETFVKTPKRPRPAHILVVSDADIFAMLDKPGGWKTAEDAVERAGGGGTFVLEIPAGHYNAQMERLRKIGWDVHRLNSQADLLAFARAFSRAKYGNRNAAPAGGTAEGAAGWR
jgi:hypothetical protein